MKEKILNFIQANSPDGGFLQSEHWKKFQESVGRKAHTISEADENGELVAFANIITHKLPIAGDYLYVPRGPVVSRIVERVTHNEKEKIANFFENLIGLAKKNNIGWIRIEPNSEEELDLIKENLSANVRVKKSAVDMQPREILVLDISRSEEEILAGMKQKTRYNIRLSQRKGVRITHNMERTTPENIEEFLRLIKITAERDGITSHPESYYRKMFETIPSEILKLYIAEYQGKIIAANLVLFFGKTATYMHGASDNEHRSVMAPYLLQWRQIHDAEGSGCEQYDFGGVKIGIRNQESGIRNDWEGITKFKTGFAPNIATATFPGCYDVILNSAKYNLYRMIQRIKKIIR